MTPAGDQPASPDGRRGLDNRHVAAGLHTPTAALRLHEFIQPEAQIGAINSSATTRTWAEGIAHTLSSIGVTFNFAPVVEQNVVVQDLAEPVGICPHPGGGRAWSLLKQHGLVGKGGGGGADGFVDGLVDEQWLRPHVELTFLGPRNGIDVVDESAKPHRLVAQGTPRVRAGGDDAVLDALEEAVQRGDGGTQLVREVGEQLPAAPFGVLQHTGHPVEGVVQRGELHAGGPHS